MIGLSSCDRTPPSAISDASVVTVNGLLKSGGWRIGMCVIVEMSCSFVAWCSGVHVLTVSAFNRSVSILAMSPYLAANCR